jgi:hypothetical protein
VTAVPYSLAELGDLEQIRALKARYCRLVDTKQWKAWGDVLTEDCEFVLPVAAADGQDRVHGRAAIVRFVSDLFAEGVSVHLAVLPEIAIVGDGRATGVWAMSDYIDMPYVETYRKDPVQGWQIASVAQTRLRTEVLAGRGQL